MTQSHMQSFSAETGKVLQLMIHSLYTNKDIFLRELISNASDACDKLRYETLTRPALQGGAPLCISVEADLKNRTLTVRDNGIGMNGEDLARNLGTIAKSGTQEFLQQLTGDSKRDLPLIGQFGVGFYSAFMAADKVEVVSRRAGEEKTYRWESDGSSGFSVGEAQTPLAHCGTQVKLHLKEGQDEYLDFFRLRHIIQTYSDHISFPVALTGDEGKKETVNAASALWTRPKAEITPEQYAEFYHHVSHSPDTPWLVLHNKAEGKIEYTNLLFIPSIRPFDLFHPDRKRRVKLYVKRVFITDEGVDLIPQYLRFLRGVIDSEDLPLNISRETLQKNPLLDKIREAVTKRVLADLKKKAENDSESYGVFWKNFGATLKEGLCEALSPREAILEACRFHTSQSPDKLVGLDEYTSRMKEGQEHIYYLTGERSETILKSPQIEGFVQRGIEVLLLSDHVDDFWVNVVREYKGKEFKSVTRSDIDLESIKAAAFDQKEEKPETPDVEVGDFIVLLKAFYGKSVKDVRSSRKLSESPVCLAVEEGAMDIRMERFLVENKQLPGRTAKILEVNPQHPVIRALAAAAAKKGKLSAEAEDAARLLLDQARILEGEEIEDAQGFSRRLSTFMQKGLAA